MKFEQKEAREVIAGAFIAAAAVLAFTSSPLLQAANPRYLAYFGFCLATALALGSYAMIFEGLSELASAFTLFAAALAGLIGLGLFAVPASAARDARCLSIERHMLAGTRDRADTAALFQALSCRPQSTADALFAEHLSAVH